MSINITKLTVSEARKKLDAHEFTAVELAKAYIDNISKRNKDLNAYLEVYADVIAAAEKADKMIQDGKATRLTGIPFAVKDNILYQDHIASSSSKIPEHYKATYDATVIQKLKEAGAVPIGRTNMDEFAMGGSTENSAFGVTKNPHDLERVAGGSSGGSAAAVAMDGAIFALGSDTGGSIRQPASFCGVVGLKPTYGAVSRYGVIAMGSSLDQIGPIANSVGDCKDIFDAIRGADIHDGTTINENTYTKKRIGKKKPA
jgi:aspartyl-tRNA(Asn)/glutamyl-tRNA(Gln) amidotransferase subunit A